MPGPQSAVGRNPTALFHLRARICIDGAWRASPSMRAISRVRIAPFIPLRIFLRSSCRAVDARLRAVRAYPVSVHERRPLHSAFADRAVGKIGRQFSYERNAEQGVRLDETRRTLDRGIAYGRGRPFGSRAARASCGLRAPPGGCDVRCRGKRRQRAGWRGARQIRCLVHRRMSGRLRPLFAPGDGAAPGALAPSLRVHRGRFAASVFSLLHLDDIAVAHRCGRMAVLLCATMPRGKTSVGAAQRDS